MNFFEALLSESFLQQGFLTAALCGIVCGIMGPIVVARQLSSAAGGLAHAVVGGMGFFAWLGLPVMGGAFAAAVVVALLLAWPQTRGRTSDESRVQVLWSIGMALGIVFLAMTPGYSIDLMSYLFGNVLLADRTSVLLTAAAALAIGGLVCWRFRQIETLCFDEEFARVIGLPARALGTMLYLSTAVSVVVLIQSVGLILVISLMTIPSLIAATVAKSLAQMIVAAVVMNIIFAWLGLWLSFVYDLPSGASIILCAGVAYLVCQVLRSNVSRRRIRETAEGSQSSVPTNA